MKKPRLILHIGRHKSGTSSLQRYFCENSQSLKEQGIYYPSSGLAPIAHHDIAYYCHKKSLQRKSENEQKRLEYVYNNLLNELTDMRGNSILLSSEAFQNCNPRDVIEKFSEFDVQVIVYVREQVSYLISAYQQRIHANLDTIDLNTYFKKHLVNYVSFLDAWASVLEPQNLKVKIYEKSALINRDLIDDFCSELGLDVLKKSEGDQNPSISGPLIELKRIFNLLGEPLRLSPKELKAVYRLFSKECNKYSSLRPKLESTSYSQAREEIEKANEEMFKKYMVDGPRAFSVDVTSYLQDEFSKPIDIQNVFDAYLTMKDSETEGIEILERTFESALGRKVVNLEDFKSLPRIQQLPVNKY